MATSSSSPLKPSKSRACTRQIVSAPMTYVGQTDLEAHLEYDSKRATSDKSCIGVCNLALLARLPLRSNNRVNLGVRCVAGDKGCCG
jgi:hypothetical protein